MIATLGRYLAAIADPNEVDTVLGTIQNVTDGDAPRCFGCGYLLIGLTEHRCPECSRVFDPKDSRTFSRGVDVGPIARFLSKPPGWLIHIPAAMCCAVFLISVSVPAGYFGLSLLAMASGILVYAAWAIRLVGIGYAALQGRLASQRTSRIVLRWIGVPLLFAITWLLALARVPLYATFLPSWPAMNRSAQQVMLRGLPNPSPQRIGLYRVSRLESIPGGMRFLVSGTGFIDPGGFAFSPDGPPAVVGEDYYTHFYGPWYIWVESW